MLSRFESRTLVLCAAKRNKADLIVLGALMAAGKVTPVIDRC